MEITSRQRLNFMIYTIKIKDPLFDIIERLKLLDPDEYKWVTEEILRKLEYEW